MSSCVFTRARQTDHVLQPKAVSETEEQDLAQLMAKAGRENAEVSGDEDDEDAV